MNPEIFCCQPFKNEWKLVVFLLFSSCFAAIFKLLRCFSRILTNFKNFSEIFQKIFRNFSEISEKFLKIFWNISEKIMNAEIFCCQRFKNEWKKWRKTSCFAAIFKLFALLFSNFDEFQKFFRNFSEFFQKFFRNFSEISEKFLKNFWNISEKFMNPEIFCCQPFKNEGN